MKLPQTTLTGDILHYRKSHTLKETGLQFNLSSERIRQLKYLKHRKRCLVHNRYFYNKCSYCLIKKSYKNYVEKLNYHQVLNEAFEQQKNKKRDYISVLKRTILIKVLYDNYDTTFVQIAMMFDKDYSTIIHLYNKHD